ncbi:hypothetical protein [Sediminibacterium sp.]|uniref:hypothetical protein n=1 Tax=Sediminibacterium sp. TaxID=1917865 RepID=UPI003F6A1384
MFKPILYTLATIIFSVLLVVYAHDIEQGIPIDPSSTQPGKQNLLVLFAKAFGFKGSIAVAILVTGGSFYYSIIQYREKNK